MKKEEIVSKLQVLYKVFQDKIDKWYYEDNGVEKSMEDFNKYMEPEQTKIDKLEKELEKYENKNK